MFVASGVTTSIPEILAARSDQVGKSPVPEFIDPRFRENKPKTLVFVIENERSGLFFEKTGSINLGTDVTVQ